MELKLRQLSRVGELDEVVVSSNDDEVLQIATDFAASLDGRIVARERPDEWGSSQTSMGRFISDYIAHLYEDGDIVWTHVTSPLIRSQDYMAIIKAYEEGLKDGHDSLVTVTRLQKFIWNRDGPVNYDPTIERWPRSQDLEPLFEINHGVYMLPFEAMRARRDRVGVKPLFFELPESIAMDIDWPDQFEHLEQKVQQARSQERVL